MPTDTGFPPPPPPPPGDESADAAGDEGAAAGRRQPPGWVWPVIALIAILVVAGIAVAATLLSRGSDEPAATTPPSSGATERPDEGDQETGGEPAVIVIPDCAALNPAAQKIADETTAASPDIEWRAGDVGLDGFSDVFGPAAQAALAASDKARGCSYPFHLEAGLRLYAAELGGAPREAFLEALRADGDFAESSDGPAQLFVWRKTMEGGHWEAAYTVHLFVGDVWVAMYGPSEPQEFAPSTIEAILAANPQLG